MTDHGHQFSLHVMDFQMAQVLPAYLRTNPHFWERSHQLNVAQIERYLLQWKDPS